MKPRDSVIHLSQQIAVARSEQHRADLHLHTVHSDGMYSPVEIVQRACRRGLGAVSITDHDTIAGFTAAAVSAAAAVNKPLEIVPGVEITSEYQDKEIHILAYFFRSDDPGLISALKELQGDRVRRLHAMVDHLRSRGIALDSTLVASRMNGCDAPGRRTLAQILVTAKQASTIESAFWRFLRDAEIAAIPKLRLPAERVLETIRQAGGVSSWAHPSPDIAVDDLLSLKELGLNAVEVTYPSFTNSQQRRLREVAQAAGLLTTGGSDCHGPTPQRNSVGAYAASIMELNRLREVAGSTISRG